MRSLHRTHRPAGCLQSRAYAGEEALDFLQRSWPGLTDRDPAATAYQDPAWLRAWARHLPASHEPLILAAVDTQTPVAALALARETGRDGRTRVTPLSWPAGEQIRPVGDETEEAVRVLLHHLPRLGDDVVAADLPEASLLTRQAQHQWGGPDSQMLYATVPLPVDLASMSRTTRRDHTRRRRTVQDLGGRVGYRRTRTTGELLDAYELLEVLHHRRNAGRPAADGTADLNLPWRQVLAQCAQIAFIATLTLDTQAVAAQLCLRRGTHAYSVVTAMDPAVRALAPGHALLHLLCEDLADDGCTALDLGRTADDTGQRAYKSAYGALWTTVRTYTAPHPAHAQAAADRALSSAAP
ncbi:GNAT family N-acetyltransferase [Streptomyces sp. NPDC048384]|uniref:GNAT family N-acetyltransferase n=1 Tax=Streptomyces sp. NPDC048384 TaxID=3155487 RepID=UPI003440F371